MSVRTMARVWDGSNHSGSELLMLLALADFADDNGRAYPSITTLAIKCRTKPRYAIVLLDNLAASGELVVLKGQGPMGRGGRTNLYRIVFDRLTRETSEVVNGSAVVNPDAVVNGSALDGRHEALNPGAVVNGSAAVHQGAGSSAPGFREVVHQGAPKPSGTVRTTKDTRKRAAGAPFILPDWIPADVWGGFVAMRKELRKPLTMNARTLMVLKLIKLREQGQDPRAVLEQSIARSWTDLYPVKVDRQPMQRNGASRQPALGCEEQIR